MRFSTVTTHLPKSIHVLQVEGGVEQRQKRIHKLKLNISHFMQNKLILRMYIMVVMSAYTDQSLVTKHFNMLIKSNSCRSSSSLKSAEFIQVEVREAQNDWQVSYQY